MLTASTQFGVTVAGKAMTLAQQLQITLPTGVQDVTANLISAEPEVDLTTDMPAGTRTAPGYASRQFTFVVDDAAGVFDPVNGPLAGASMHYLPVVFKEGLTLPGAGAELLPQFTGSTVAWKRSSAAKTVTFTCVDGRAKLKKAVNLAAVVTAAPYNAGLTSEFAMDYLLRQASNGAISSWPAQRPGCVFAAGFRSSMWPEVGTFDTVSGAPLQQPVATFAAGAMGTALQSNASPFGVGFDSVSRYTLAAPLGTSLYVELWTANMDATSSISIDVGAATAADAITIDVGTTVTVSSDSSGGFGPSLSSPAGTTAGTHRIGVKVALPAVGGTACTATIYVDTVSVASGAITWAAARAATLNSLIIQANAFVSGAHTGTLEALQVTTETAPTITTFTPQAVLDPSLNALDAVPAITGDPWQAIQLNAEAEGGVAGFDESGIFRFKNRLTLTSSPSVRTITSSGMQPVDLESDSTALATRVQVGYTGWNFGKSGLIWQAAGVRYVPAGQSRTWTITLPSHATLPSSAAWPDLVANVDTVASVLPTGQNPADGNSWFRASTDRFGQNENKTAKLKVAAVSSNQLQLTATAGARPAYFVSPANYTDTGIAAGDPAIWIGGQPVTQDDEILVDTQWPPLEYDGTGGAASVDPPGEVLLSVTGNPWIQDDATARAYALDMLSALHRAPLIVESLDITPDVRLQIGDRVTLVDDVSGLNEPVTIWGSRRAMSIDGNALTYTQQVDVRLVASRIGGWILGDTSRGVLGVTTRL